MVYLVHSFNFLNQFLKTEAYGRGIIEIELLLTISWPFSCILLHHTLFHNLFFVDIVLSIVRIYESFCNAYIYETSCYAVILFCCTCIIL